MEPMSFWQLVENNPEWAGVIASATFAFFTLLVITWQVCVMIWQGRNSDRHERIQNRLIRLQHEHEWVLRKNQEREQLLKLGRKLHLDLGVLEHSSSEAEATVWAEMKDTMYELDSRLKILDLATFSTLYDKWYFTLGEYVEAVVKIVVDEPSEFPSDRTKKALYDAEQHHKPIEIFLNIEEAIRMEFFDFKGKWDAALP